jgi:hypothetical protein
MFLERDLDRYAVRGMAVVAILFALSVFGVVPDRVDRHQQGGRLLAEIAGRSAPVRVAALGALEPSWVFYGGRPVMELDDSGRAGWSGAYVEIDGRWQRKPAVGLEDLAANPERWLLITTEKHLALTQAELPAAFEVLTSAPYFLKKDRLLLLGAPREADSVPQLARPAAGIVR